MKPLSERGRQALQELIDLWNQAVSEPVPQDMLDKLNELGGIVWSGDPDEVFDIMETLDANQEHTWAFQMGGLWIDDTRFEPGSRISLEGLK